ncbi:hypothetical protein [Streptosporangium sp. NBC_01469]|uniref:hypothetical protein n=1 Tax=Streptosporangium sp. NBC_01469 TaxID=2903898 RepID=UPI002E2B5EE1|nr:hypothetical protein [Streptosporangium sp. NBC_01469]
MVIGTAVDGLVAVTGNGMSPPGRRADWRRVIDGEHSLTVAFHLKHIQVHLAQCHRAGSAAPAVRPPDLPPQAGGWLTKGFGVMGP